MADSSAHLPNMDAISSPLTPVILLHSDLSARIMIPFHEYLSSVLNIISAHEEHDAIRGCNLELHQISNRTDEYLELANDKIHVFPFSQVKPCWFRLFTDASIVKATHIIQPHITTEDENTSALHWVDEAIRVLDMALIMAGGVGREDLIQTLIDQLQDYVAGIKDDSQPAKRQRLADDNPTLPAEEVSVPQIRRDVPRVTHPTMEYFQAWSNNEREPLILQGILDHWPALSSWKRTSYWRELTFGGRRLVPIETGRSYVDDGWGQKIVAFGHFLDTYILGSHRSDEIGYLAQHDLFRQLPALEAAVSTPDYCYVDAPPPQEGTPLALKIQSSSNPKSHPTLLPKAAPDHQPEDESDVEVQRNIWFGPAWTVSPLHHDPYHNILCQVVGKKYIRLYSPHVSQKLNAMSAAEPAPHLGEIAHGNSTTSKHSIDMSNTSKIDVAAMELSPHEDWDDTYPGISKVPYFECVLSAGQALYIPIGWWHYVRSCSVGISVSYWW